MKQAKSDIAEVIADMLDGVYDEDLDAKMGASADENHVGLVLYEVDGGSREPVRCYRITVEDE